MQEVQCVENSEGLLEEVGREPEHVGDAVLPKLVYFQDLWRLDPVVHELQAQQEVLRQ